LSAERRASLEQRLAGLQTLPLNRDLYPRGYFLGLKLWAEQAGPAAVRWLNRAGRLPPTGLAWPAILLALIGVFLGWKKDQARRSGAVIATAAMGFAGMAAEIAVMMAFQVIQGYLYQSLGLIVAAFMVGLALGAGFGEWRLRTPARASLIGLGRLLALLLLALFLVWETIGWLEAGASSGLVTALALSGALFVLAAVCGAIFSSAAALFLGDRKKVGHTAGWINGADLLGGALGALLTSAVIVPVFGLADALEFSALLLAAALVVILVAIMRRRKEA
jgi:hypothetical protein